VVAVPGDDRGRRTPQHAGPDPITTAILADMQRRARSRIRAQDEHRRAARELEEGLASLATYYGSRRPRSIPLAQFLAERWWAA
jgi:hypothetical protein